MVSSAWSENEVEEVVQAYFEMLMEELRGTSFVKAERNRELRALLVDRTRSSIEFKHQNISAVLSEYGAKYIDGYKPLFNYQSFLRGVVIDRLNENSDLLDELEKAAMSPEIVSPKKSVLELMDPAPPHRGSGRASTCSEGVAIEYPRRDFMALQERNAKLGEAGEQLAMDFERSRLRKSGREDLAGKVEQVSKTLGDWAGFDVLSFEENGSERFIEVKATHFGPYTSFFVSENQRRKSKRHQDRYYLYRAYGMREVPRMYSLHGALDEVCNLSAVEYRARVG